jgi:hypothetical protein
LPLEQPLVFVPEPRPDSALPLLPLLPLPSLLSRSSFQPRNQSSHQLLPIAPPRLLLMPQVLRQAQHPLSPSAQPSLRPLPIAQDQPSPFRLLLALERPLVRHPLQPLLRPSVLHLPPFSRNPPVMLPPAANCIPTPSRRRRTRHRQPALRLGRAGRFGPARRLGLGAWGLGFAAADAGATAG